MNEAAAQVSRCLKLLIVGVGGQGVLSIARWLGDAAVLCGLEVRVGQLHGMSQRGGNVEASVLIGPGHSSFIPDGGADVAVGLEPLELARACRKMSGRTIAVVSSAPIVPFPLAMQGKAYPDPQAMLARVRALVGDLIEINGPALAARAGFARSLNVVMMGVLSQLKVLPMGDEVVLTAIERRCPLRLRPHLRKAFMVGREAVQR